jgi:altronate dehydratase
VNGADQGAERREDIVVPHIVRETEVEAASFISEELLAVSHLSFKKGQDLSTLIVETQCTRSSGTSLTLEVLQETENGR